MNTLQIGQSDIFDAQSSQVATWPHGTNVMAHGLSRQIEHELVPVSDAPIGFPSMNIRRCIGSFE